MNDVFKVVGKYVVETAEAKNNINEVTNQAEESTSKIGNLFSSMGDTIMKVGQTVAIGVGAAATAIVGVTKSAVDSYGEYEQLVGGVETLFKDSADIVMQYANNAYKTAGLSANEYMETVTSFSASLLQGLGGNTEQAAKTADLAITDMADNANKMGTDISRIQDAYQGFAKQNYTMLDNLKLGYGGTKTEMERLIKDANALNKQQGINTKYTIENFNDIIDAIHVVQTNIGITGTTALEAEGTLQGSMSAVMSAWKNVMVGLADENQNLGELIDILIDNLVILLSNMIPRIKIVFSKIPGLLLEVLKLLPPLIIDLLPDLILAATELVLGLVEAAPEFLAGLWEILPQISQTLLEIIDNLGLGGAIDFVLNNLNTIITTIEAATGAFIAFKASMVIGTAIQSFQEAQLAIQLLSMEIGGANLAQAALNGTLTFGETIIALLTGKITLAELATGLWAKTQAVLNGVMSANPIGLVAIAIAALVAIIIVCVKNWDKIKVAAENAWNAMKNAFSKAAAWMNTNVIQPIVKYFKEMWANVVNIFDLIKNVIHVALLFIANLIKFAFDLITIPFRFIWENCKETIIKTWESIKTTISNALNIVKNTIQSAFNYVYNNIIAPVGNAISTFLANTWNAISTTIANAWASIYNFISGIVSSIYTAITSKVNQVKTSVEEKFEAIKTSISSSLQTAYDTVSDIFSDIYKKITDKIGAAKDFVKEAIDKIKGFFDFEWSLPSLKLPHISISGSWSLKPPSAPSFGIEWYKQGGILEEPMAFGINPSSGNIMAGGEAGKEAVAPLSDLMGYVRTAVSEANSNSSIVDVLRKIYELLSDDERLKEIFIDALVNGNFGVVLDGREVGRIVKKYA